ncbi:MAG TPA: 1,4-alpha-glucan branching enzyme [Gammaproteobacteria bacterium]|nr:1,4-alpha-glucan branching enzyme [Gammaproteobacteria bacterium]
MFSDPSRALPLSESTDYDRLLSGRHHAPHSLLGHRPSTGNDGYRIFHPDAQTARIKTEHGWSQMHPLTPAGLFEWVGLRDQIPPHPQIQLQFDHGAEHTFLDPYSFTPDIPEDHLNSLGSNTCWRVHHFLGSHFQLRDGITGIRFAVWAPNAERVSVVGDFNHWNGRVHPMNNRGASGIWELFIPSLDEGINYKYEIRHRSSGHILLKSDPYARQYQLRPDTASVTQRLSDYRWQDGHWMMQREQKEWLHAPLSIYEIHLGSWQRDENNQFLSYREIADRLVPYLLEMGFNALQLMPVTEHPLDDSWGYQVTGYFAPTSRFGHADDLRYLIDLCHQNDIRVLLDWVPAHFPRDQHALANFDGTALYEHEDPRRGEHRDWGTLIFNYGRTEVKNFLLSSAFFWLEEFHIDGLRVDAVASMLYLDYSRNDGDWTPNQYGGNENLEAIDFLRDANTILHKEHPGSLIIAEESTAWPMVSRPVYLGGLGFSMKWNMGWMNDTLSYISHDPVHRQYHHDQLTFGLLYAFTENFILPLSHDEVVHQKRSLLYKMPGDEWQRFANLRLLFLYMFTQPGKKLLFMGGEFGQGEEWNHHQALDWYLLQYDFHGGIQKLVADLNRLYCNEPALHRYDFEEQGFQWIDCHDSTQSIISYLRKEDDSAVLVILNFTPIVRSRYRIGVPKAGAYGEILNSDSIYYRGSNVSNGDHIPTEAQPHMGFEQSIVLDLPPLGGLILKHKT